MKMVLHKRMEHGSGEYKVPPMPQVPRSAKGKRSIRKKREDKKTSAFDLLATIAGELLLERENSPTNGNVKHGQNDERPFKVEVFGQVSCNESTLHFESVNKSQVDCSLKEQMQTPKSLEKNATEKRELCECKAEIKHENFTEMDLDVKPDLKNGSFPKCQDVSELIVDRDDDENSSGCTYPSTNVTKAFKPQHIGDRRIRKMLASKFWKVPSSALKNGEQLSNTGVEKSSFKRRKMLDRRSISASDLDIYGESVCSSLKFSGIETDRSDAHSSLNRASSSTSVPKSSYESGDYHVKFSIKSFKVPELFIEIPETATVGSLKRTVMEAVTVILAGAPRVGVLLEGKNVRDDKQTLLQAGISRHDKIENLGFTLEHNPTQRIPGVTLAINNPDSDRDSVYSKTDASSSVDKITNSKAIVPVPAITKSRRSELAQRRIRRPFSVAEVEALVHAVEKLGTGRWRDVKMKVFDNARHRTYVDLKDKWKTLVHTARISAQQRRGEPVPQELLDRVLAAHAYWSKQQAKLQVRLSQTESCMPII